MSALVAFDRRPIHADGVAGRRSTACRAGSVSCAPDRFHGILRDDIVVGDQDEIVLNRLAD